MSGFEGRLGEQHAVIGYDTDQIAMNPRKPGDDRRAVARLELVQTAAVNQTGNDLVDIVGDTGIVRDDAVEFSRIIGRVFGRFPVEREFPGAGEILKNRAGDFQGVGIILGQVVGYARHPRVYISAAEFFRGDFLARGRFHQRRTAQENRALVFDDYVLIRHGRHIRSPGGAGAHHHGDLGDAQGGHAGFVVENTPEVFAVRENIGLKGQVRAAGIHQIHTRQAVLLTDFLGAQMLFDGHGIIGAAFDRGIVGNNDGLAALNQPDAGDNAGRGRIVIHAVRGQGRQLQKRRIRIKQGLNTLAGQQFPPGLMPLARGFRPTQPGRSRLFFEAVHQRGHMGRVGLELG